MSRDQLAALALGDTDPLSVHGPATMRRRCAVPLDTLPPLRWPDWAVPGLQVEPVGQETAEDRQAPGAISLAQFFQLAQSFPVGALVRAVVQLAVPAPGEVGVVVGVTPNGQIKVKASPAALMWHGCDPRWLRRVERPQ